MVSSTCSVKPCKVPSGHKKIVGALQPTRTYDHGKSRERSSSTLAGVDKYLDECTDYFRRTKVLQTISKHGGFGKVKPLLLCGSSGCGKTSIAKEVAERLATDRTVLARKCVIPCEKWYLSADIHPSSESEIHYVDCKATRASSGQSITTTREMIRGWVADAAKHGPCILVLDGLDAVVRPDMEVRPRGPSRRDICAN
jgi:SpoVK/Ycf46/Vps4 family AAA+-type ATPase